MQRQIEEMRRLRELTKKQAKGNHTSVDNSNKVVNKIETHAAEQMKFMMRAAEKKAEAERKAAEMAQQNELLSNEKEQLDMQKNEVSKELETKQVEVVRLRETVQVQDEDIKTLKTE